MEGETVPRRRRLRLVPLALLGLLLMGAGLGVGIGIAHWGTPQQFSWLSPSYFQPRNQAAAERRVIALVIGQTRATDGMTYGAWYRDRLNKMAPGIRFEYQALLSGNDYCGYWNVYALVIPGPALGPANTIAVLNDNGTVGTVDENSGRVAGLDEHSAGTSIYSIDGKCVHAPQDAGGTWLDEFRSGAAP